MKKLLPNFYMSEECSSLISLVMQKISRAVPLKTSHRRELPRDINKLSMLLTQERGDLHQSYWMTPGLASAYLYYFLPWNLYRFAWLLPQLDFELNNSSRVLDLGTGPLTLPIAMWLFYPSLRDKEIEFTCCDSSSKALELGKKVFYELTGDDCRWKIKTLHSSLEIALSKKHTHFDLITGANILNELVDNKKVTFEERVKIILSKVLFNLKDSGKVFFMEPGTRLGAKTIGCFRKLGIDCGLSSVSPCLHNEDCPMYFDKSLEPSSRYTGWCHFIFYPNNSPKPLKDLSSKAKIEKHSLSLSYILMDLAGSKLIAASNSVAKGLNDSKNSLNHDVFDEEFYESILSGDEADDSIEHKFSEPKNIDYDLPVDVKIISSSIKIENGTRQARYGCSVYGLMLVDELTRLFSGGVINCKVVKDGSKAAKDFKSGAIKAVPSKVSSSHYNKKDDFKKLDGAKEHKTQANKPYAGRPKMNSQEFDRSSSSRPNIDKSSSSRSNLGKGNAGKGNAGKGKVDNQKLGKFKK